MTADKWRLSTFIRCFSPLQGATQQVQQPPDAQPDVALLCARIEALEQRIEVLEAQNKLLRDEVEAGRAEKKQLLEVITKGLLTAPKKRRKGKKKGR